MEHQPKLSVAALAQEVSLQRLAEAQGVSLSEEGKALKGLCPFHDDDESTLTINPVTNVWSCSGNCAGGGVIKWTMRAERVSRQHAIELLRNDFATVELPPTQASEGRTAGLGTIASPDEPDSAVMQNVVDYYHQTLKDSPDALAWLAGRGLTNPDLIDTFKLGHANRTLGYRLPAKTRKTGAAIRAQLQRLGILRDTGHEHLTGSIVVPIFGEDGQVVQMYGWKITKGLRKGTPLHLYLPGPQHGVFNPRALATDEHIILCQSLIDAMTFWCSGIRNVTAAFGFTDELMEAFKQGNVQQVTIAFRRDDEGRKATEKIAERLAAEGISVHAVQFPKGMDVNAFALKAQPAEKTLSDLLRRAVWIAGHSPNKSAPTAPDATIQLSKPLPSAIPGGAAPNGPTVEMELSDHEQRFTFGDRQVRIRGLSNNRSYDQLKINLLMQRGGAFFVDTVDLYLARQRAAYIKQAAEELKLEQRTIKQDLGKVLLKLEDVQEAAIAAALAPKEVSVVLSEEEQHDALALLKDPSLLDRILVDFESCGVVGEETNKLAGYLGCISRKLDRPLAMIVQSTSAAGKSALMESVLAFVPDEECIKYSAMTGQSLYYLGEQNVKHRVLAITEEKGAERATYALKLLQSEGELTIASTGKDLKTGKLITTEYHVEGPVMLFLTTTAIEMDEELLNRCLVLSVDEGAEQTAAIHKAQRESRTLQGLLGGKEREAIIKLHQNAQRLIRPLAIVNPYADRLTFAAHRTRMRRDHLKYLSLIDAIALLHQHQREVKSVEHDGEALEYIEVTAEDIAVANRLAHRLLGRSLDDLPPQTRRLLGLVDEMVVAICEAPAVDRPDVRFSRRQVREHCGWSYEQIRVHLGRLVDMEYLIVHRGARGRTFVYELCHDGGTDNDDARFSGLIDVSKLETTGTTRALGGEKGEFGVPCRGHTGPLPGVLGGSDSTSEDAHEPDTQQIEESPSETAHQGTTSQAQSCVQRAGE